MNRLSVSIRQIADTRAAVGWAGVKCVVADRPKDVAGGLGLGLSGGELQALALGAGTCNQLQFSADALGLEITTPGVHRTQVAANQCYMEFDPEQCRKPHASLADRTCALGRP